MKKNLGLGLLAGVGILIIEMLATQLAGLFVPGYLTEIQNGQIFRPWTDPLMMLFFVYPFLIGVIFAWFWNFIKKIVKGKTALEKGFNFAVIYFALATIPGMFITLSSFQISFFMVLVWAISGFVEVFFAGWLLAKLNS